MPSHLTLGLSAFYHDSSAVLLDGKGNILGAVQEERFTRKKHTCEYPENAVKWCLELAKYSGDQIGTIAFYEQPFLKLSRILDTVLSFSPTPETVFSDALPDWTSNKAFMLSNLANSLENAMSTNNVHRILKSIPHHASHAASAYYPSPWNEALIITLDGVGEFATTTVSIGKESTITPVKEIHFPHSLGLVYSAITSFCGFKVNSGEYKLMGLAPYGQPEYADTIREHLIHIYPDGSYAVNSTHFDSFMGKHMLSPMLNDLFDGDPLPLGAHLSQREANIAASVQVVLEEAVLNLVRSQIEAHGIRKVCLAGGVALNCVANGRILRELPVEGLWVQPASGDAGGALGAALFCHYASSNKTRATRNTDSMNGALLGPSYSDETIRDALSHLDASFEQLAHNELIERCASLLADGASIGWFQGRMEYGPRALGCRSILADPRSPTVQRDLNLKIKKRESFRPFAPAVLAEFAQEWFDIGAPSSYMLITAPVLDKRRLPQSHNSASQPGPFRVAGNHSTIPAVTHVDYSARVQTIEQDSNPVFHALVSKFHDLTGCPMVLNTSFNVRGEPIVMTPADAFKCFMNTDIDYLAIGNCLLAKNNQDPLVALKCMRTYEPD